MQALNLDGLVPAKKTLTLNGKVYEVKEMSVEDFLAALKAADEIDATKPVTLKENIQQTIDHIVSVIPGLPESEIKGLNVNQLTALVAFVNGTVKEQGANPAEVAAPN